MFEEDLSVFFNTQEFADEAMLDGVDVAGIFDKAFVSSSGGMGMTVSRPAFILPASSVPADTSGSMLVIGSDSYAIAGIDPDASDDKIIVLLLEVT